MIAEAIEGDFRTPSNISEIVCVDGFLDENIKADELAEMFENIPTYSMNYKNGYDFAVKKASDENKAVAVFGSLFLVTELKEYIENNSSK
jgi:folylpolyglutamate synthase/dihydropteroate synthase